MSTVDVLAAGGRRARSIGRPPPAAARVVLVLALLGLWEGAVAAGVVDRLTVPAPSDCLPRLVDILGTGQFWSDAGRSFTTTLLAFGAASVVGLLLGALLARSALLATILEPYLVAAYAIPVIVFYPMFLVFFGIGVGPIVLTAFLGAVVPVILGTTVALRQQSAVHRKLARTLGCTTGQALRKITVPGVLPLLLPGLKLAFIYAMAGTVGVEFIVANAGLGFRTGERYRNFETVDMYAHIVALFALAVLVNELFNVVERLVRKDLS